MARSKEELEVTADGCEVSLTGDKNLLETADGDGRLSV